MAYIIKLIAVSFAPSLLIVKNANVSVYQACLLGLTDFLTIVIPFYCVVDAAFIKIIKSKHLLEGTDRDSRLSNFDFENIGS